MVVGGRPASPSELDAIVRLGDCSGVLVRANLVLTSAHGIDGAVTHAYVRGTAVPIARCAQHPSFPADPSLHDIGFCELARVVPIEPLPLETSGVDVGGGVILAGYGTTHAFGRDGASLRMADTVVTRVGNGILEVGTADRTACWGDSGGPVMIVHDGSDRIVGIVRGSSGAICASPATAVPVAPQRAWLEGVVGVRPPDQGSGLRAIALAIAFLALFVLFLRVRVHRRAV